MTIINSAEPFIEWWTKFGMVPHVQFVVVGRAVAQGSKRHVGNGRMIEQNPGVKPWRALVRTAAAAAWEAKGYGEPWKDPVRVQVVFHFTRPQSHYRSNGTLRAGVKNYCIGRQDNEKLQRAIMDAMAGVVYCNDNRVCSVSSDKRYDDHDWTVITASLL